MVVSMHQCLDKTFKRMVPTGTGKPGKMGRHFPVRESQGILPRLEKSQNFTQNIGKILKKKNCTEKLKKILEKSWEFVNQ